MTKKLWTVVHEGVGSATRATADQDAEAHTLIGLHVSPQHHTTVANAGSAKEAWDTLADIYAAKSFSRRMQLRKQLYNLAKEPTESVTQYVSRVQTLQGQLVAVGMTIADTEVCWSILMGLSEEYSTISTLMENSGDELEIPDVMGKLQTVEDRLKQHQQHYEQLRRHQHNNINNHYHEDSHHSGLNSLLSAQHKLLPESRLRERLDITLEGITVPRVSRRINRYSLRWTAARR